MDFSYLSLPFVIIVNLQSFVKTFGHTCRLSRPAAPNAAVLHSLHYSLLPSLVLTQGSTKSLDLETPTDSAIPRLLISVPKTLCDAFQLHLVSTYRFNPRRVLHASIAKLGRESPTPVERRLPIFGLCGKI